MSSPCHVHVHAGRVVNTLTISLSFHYGNPTHPSSGGKLCMWTVFVLMIECLYVEWSKSSNGEVVTAFKSFIRFINNRLQIYIDPIFVHAVHVCE